MLRVGYVLLMLAGAGLVGFAGYHLVRILLLATGIPLFLRIVILLAGLGLVLTLAGLIRERRKETRSAADNHDDD